MSAIYVARSVFGSQKDYADKGVTTRCDDNPLFGEVVWAPSQDQNMKRSDRTWKETGQAWRKTADTVEQDSMASCITHTKNSLERVSGSRQFSKQITMPETSWGTATKKGSRSWLLATGTARPAWEKTGPMLDQASHTHHAYLPSPRRRRQTGRGRAGGGKNRKDEEEEHGKRKTEEERKEGRKEGRRKEGTKDGRNEGRRKEGRQADRKELQVL